MDATLTAPARADQEPTTAEKIRKLPWSIFANSTNTIFAQFTVMGSIFVLFLNTLGLSKSAIGFLLSIVTFYKEFLR